MLKLRANRGNWLVAGLLPLIIVVPEISAQDAVKQGNKITAGNARFSVLSQTCIRLEYAPNAQFTDKPTWIAWQRDSLKDENFTMADAGGKVTITTAKVELSYTKGGAFDANNLSITTKTDKPVTWKPGMAKSGNLGGSRKEVHQKDAELINSDGYFDEGIISSDGWHLIEDTTAAIVDGSWKWWEKRDLTNKKDWYFFG
jgi:hypothetical protein